MSRQRIPRSVARRLGWYVYGYVRGGRIRYVGKGRGQRALAHHSRIPGHRVDVLSHALPDERTAFAVEAAVIEAVGLRQLRNRIRGRGKVREPIADVVRRYGARRVWIREPSILIRINKLYRPGMSARQLYEVTRGVWVIGKRRETVRYACAVYEGVILAVYRIRKWYRAGTTPYRYRTDVRARGRWEFVGSLVRSPYVGGSVEHLHRAGAQNPIRYVP